jgi:predicted dehydrogenase
MAVNRVVVVGCGSIGQRHARLLAERAGIQVDLCDTSKSCLAETQELIGNRECYNNFSAMLTTRPDAILVATPHAHHAGQVVAALEAGIHVLCEKPMSDDVSSARRIIAAANASDAVLDVGFTLHFHPPLRRLRELCRSGALGEIVHAHCRVGTYATLACSRSQHQAHVEGALLLDYVHQPDVLQWILNRKPNRVFMNATCGGTPPLSSDPNVAEMLIDYAAGLQASIHLNYLQHPQRHEYEIVGDKAWAVLDAESNCLRVGTRESNTVTTETFDFERDDMFIEEHQAFLDATAGKRPPESPAESAAVSIRVVDAAMRSWKAGTPAAVEQT